MNYFWNSLSNTPTSSGRNEESDGRDTVRPGGSNRFTSSFASLHQQEGALSTGQIDAMEIGTLDDVIDAAVVPSSQEVDQLVAKEMCSLSVNAREEVFTDLHGVSEEVEETPDLLSKGIEELQMELQQLDEKDALTLAVTENPGYVLKKDFLLRFLRTDRFNAKAAAQRMAKHFEYKLDLFGRSKLTKDITQDDLGKDEISLLYDGVNQMLPLRDRAGRTVFITMHINRHRDHDALLRRYFYAATAFFEDVETQRKGCVGIFWGIGTVGVGVSVVVGVDSLSGKLAKLSNAMPRRVEAIHFCYDTPAWIPVMLVYQWSLGMFTRLRVKAHYGSQEECVKKLESFGIPTCVLPFQKEGKWNKELYVQILEKRRVRERLSLQQSDRQVGVPSRNDVLFGRGKHYQMHVGNARFRSLIDDCKPLYGKASKDKKTQISKEIVEIVQQSGGRFLKDDGAGWVVVDDEVAREKVSHVFRSKSKSKK